MHEKFSVSYGKDETQGMPELVYRNYICNGDKKALEEMIAEGHTIRYTHGPTGQTWCRHNTETVVSVALHMEAFIVIYLH